MTTEILRIGSPARYRDMPCIVHGFTSTGLVKVWNGVTMFAVKRDKVKRGKVRKDLGGKHRRRV